MTTITPRRPRSPIRRTEVRLAPAGPALALAAVLAAACNPASTRPAFAPYPEDQSILLTGPVATISSAVAGWMASQGIHTEWISAEDGYVESTWYDTDTHQNTDGTGDLAALEATFKVRVWVDPDAPGKSRLTVEAIYRPVADPSRTERDQERVAPPGSGGAVLAQQLVDEMQKKFGGS